MNGIIWRELIEWTIACFISENRRKTNDTTDSIYNDNLYQSKIRNISFSIERVIYLCAWRKWNACTVIDSLHIINGKTVVCVDRLRFIAKWTRQSIVIIRWCSVDFRLLPFVSHIFFSILWCLFVWYAWHIFEIHIESNSTEMRRFPTSLGLPPLKSKQKQKLYDQCPVCIMNVNTRIDWIHWNHVKSILNDLSLYSICTIVHAYIELRCMYSVWKKNYIYIYHTYVHSAYGCFT